jgi:hypothetical protein
MDRGGTAWVGLAGFCAVVGVSILPTEAASQNPDRRTVFRCESAGRISYSDAPCPEAEKVDSIRLHGVNPPRAPDRVAYRAPGERAHDGTVGTWQPSTAKQSAGIGPRIARFLPGANPECPHLAQRMALVEAEERAATAHTIATIQERLAVQRHWYWQLGCPDSEPVPTLPAVAPAPTSDPPSAYGYAG